MDCMKELMKYSYMLIYKVGEYRWKGQRRRIKKSITAPFTIYVTSI